jgi:hypothetical protein
VTLTPPPTASLALGANTFNSVTGPPLLVLYQCLGGGKLDLKVYNVANACVRHMVSAALPVGSYTAQWDGKDDNGEPVYSGLYLVTVIESGRLEIKKVVAVHQ